MTSFEVRLISVGHLLEQRLGIVFVHDVDAVADAFGVTEIDSLADVKAEPVGRDEARGKFAGMERDVDRGVDAVEIVEHEHLAVVLGHGHVSIFRLHEVEADDAWILRCDFKGEESLGEDLLWREGAEDLIKEADFNRAGGSSIGLATVFDLVAGFESVVEFFAIEGYFVAEAVGEQCVA
jgi:hypothetical protein